MKKIAVLLYLYDTALWKEYKTLLEPIKNNIVLFLALSKDDFCKNNNLIENDAKLSFELAETIYTDNKGSDIGPFLLQLTTIDSAKYPLFLKLHSKKSLWGIHKNISWRSLLVHSLIGNKNIFDKNIELMYTNPTIGMIGNTGLLLDREKEGFNTELIFDLLYNTLDIPLEQIARRDLSFLGGSIFLSRTKLFQMYFTKDIIKKLYDMFPIGIVDDSKQAQVAHSLERIFGYIVNFANLQFANGYIDHKIKIIHQDSQAKYDLVKCYDNTCYIDSNIIYSGTKFDISEKSFLVNWKYSNKNGFWKKYTKIQKDLYYS